MSLDLYRSSCAIDYAGIDQEISGTSEVLLAPSNVIWDLNSDYSVSDSVWVAPINGIYTLDLALKFTNFSNVDNITLGIYLNDDDFWFVLFEKPIVDEPELQINSFLSLNASQGDRFSIKVILNGTDPSCSIIGDDDYTAWGYTFRYHLD